MKKNLAMEQKIAELYSHVEDSRARERWRDTQFDVLIASGGIPPCSSDATFPPRPHQSQPTWYTVYGKQRNMTYSTSSGEEEDDDVEDTLPH